MSVATLEPEAYEVAARDFEIERPPEWRKLARPEQLPPPGEWLTWAYIAGRGAGKTRSAAELTHEWATAAKVRIALVGRTPADVRDIMIEGESGLLAVARDNRPVYQPTKRRMTWPNGSIATTYSAEVPAQLRGPQHHFAWADEAAAWTDAPKGDVVDTAWNNLMLGLRLGQRPQCVVTTTPKPNKLIKALLARPSTVVTKGTTYDNLANLAPSFREKVLAAYEGTRIGRQELLGEILEDVEGALWTIALIDATRVPESAVPELQRVVVAIDPSGGEGPDSDEQGIIVAGLGVDGEVYVLADRSCKLSPHGWASRAIAAYHEFSADKIIAERNFGGDMVEATILTEWSSAPVKVITASRGKVQRAEPVAAAYEKRRVHHVGPLSKLEDQMTTWTPADGASPDRMDALVWAVTELTDNFGAAAWIAWAKRKAEEAAGTAVAVAEPVAAVPEPQPQVTKPVTFTRQQQAKARLLIAAGGLKRADDGSWLAKGKYRVTEDSCDCPASGACYHMAAVAMAGGEPPSVAAVVADTLPAGDGFRVTATESAAPLDPAAIRKAARDAAFRAQQSSWR